jgi:hypothetical protein
VVSDFAGDKMTVFVALASDLIDDQIGSVLSWEALDWWERDCLIAGGRHGELN